MRRKKFCIILIGEAALLAVLNILQVQFSGIFSTMTAFPFEQIGWGLRWLSLSGRMGNVCAVILYVLVSLFPVLVWYAMRKKHRDRGIDRMLFALSALLFIMLYFMVNPGLLPAGMPGGKMLFGGTFYSVACGYLVLRLLKAYASAGIQRLHKGLHILLLVMSMVFVYGAFGSCLGNLLSSVREVGQGNSAAGMGLGILYQAPSLMPTYLMLALRFVVKALPYLLDIVVVFMAGRTLEDLEKDAYSEAAAVSVESLGRACSKILAVTVITDMLLNILQLAFCGKFYQISISVTFPVTSIVFVLAILLFARYVRENQKLKQENDLFV